MKIDELQNKNISVRNCIGIIQNQEQIVIYGKNRNYFNLLQRNQMNDRNGHDDERRLGRWKTIHSLRLLFFIAII